MWWQCQHPQPSDATLVPPSPPGREQRQTLNPITDNEPCLAATALLPAARDCPWAAPRHPLAALPPGVLYRGLPEKLWLAEPCLASLFCLLLGSQNAPEDLQCALHPKLGDVGPRQREHLSTWRMLMPWAAVRQGKGPSKAAAFAARQMVGMV